MMKSPFSLEKFLDLLCAMEIEEKQEPTKVPLMKAKTTFSNSGAGVEQKPNHALINLITMKNKNFKRQLLFTSSQLSSYLDEANFIGCFKRNTRSMPMK